jgi:hypothetical protein
MNFYASSEYLAVVAEAYFKGQRTSVEDVRIGGDALRVLVVDDKRVITSVPFLDYHEPLSAAEIRTPTRKFCYAQWVVRGIIEQAGWEFGALRGFVPAPYVDWSMFPTYDDYQAHIEARRKGLLREHKRRRRRLAENFGELVFCMDDTQKDVFELARLWKGQQLVETGEKNYFADPRNVEYFNLLRQKGLLTSSTLRADGRLLSVWIGFTHDRVWSGWIFTYDHDPELRKYSLGHQLLHSMLEESYRRKHREFDFSIGDEDYKRLYTTHARLLGPIGRAPVQQRILARVKHGAKRALSLNRKLLEMALGLRDVIRKRGNRAYLLDRSDQQALTSVPGSRGGSRSL